MVFQAETNECGLACLAMVCSFHGCGADLNGLRSRLGTAALGTSVRQIIDLAGRMKFKAKALRLEMSDLRNLVLPAILHWDLDHYIVLKKVSRNSVLVHDPASGIRKYPLHELANHFTGVAIEFYPLRDFKPTPRVSSLALKDLLKGASLPPGSIGLVFVLTLLLQLLAILNPLYLQLVIDQGLVKGDNELVFMLAMLFVFIVVVKVTLAHMRGIHLLHFGNRLGFQLVSGVACRLSSLPLSYFEKREMGDIVSRFGSLENIRRLITQEMITVVVDGIFSVITLLLLYLYSPVLGSIVLLAVCLYTSIRIVSISPERELRKESIITAAKQQTRFMENIRTISVAKVNAVESIRQNEWETSYTEQINAGFRLDLFQLNLGSAQSTIFGLENIATIFVGASAVGGGALTIGQLMSFVLLKQHFIGSVAALLPKLSEIRMMSLELERVADVVQMNSPPDDAWIGLLPAPCDGKIELVKLGFTYEKPESPLFCGINFRFPAGKMTAITGPSGCGKSTLLKLILGLEKPLQGSILIGGKDIKLINRGELRAKTSAVLHGDGLLSGDLAYNIHLGVGAVDWKRLQELSIELGLSELIEHLPLGYSTEIGELGNVLSAGQVQRILLARALYRNPALLLLDESLSNLNAVAGISILNYIKSLNITLLMVTHHRELLEHADSILELG